MALTGLPGSVKTGVSSVAEDAEALRLAGCIATLSNDIVPTRDSTSLTVS